MKSSKVAEMRALDRTAMEEFGIPEELLMENAGHAVYFALLKEFEIKDRRFLLVCGTGHFDELQEALILTKQGRLQQPNSA